MDKIELSPEQQQAVVDFWNKTPSNPPSIKDIVAHVFGTEYDLRSPEWKAVMAFLAARGLKRQRDKEKIELNENHQKYIQNHYKTSSAVEIARDIFANPNLTNLHAEARAVAEYIKSIAAPEDLLGDTAQVPTGNYQPPETLHATLKKVNEYTNNLLNKEKLTVDQKKGLEALMRYLHNGRFLKQINCYDKEGDRVTFEDSFIRYTYDKPDLTQEEVDQYCTLANEVVSSFDIQARKKTLNTLLDNLTENSKGEDTVKMSMSLNEAITAINGEFNDCVKRQQTLLNALTEKRSDKLDKKIADNASVLNIIKAWQQEENRKIGLARGRVEESDVKEEIEKMTSMADFKAKILGLSATEALYG
jgi:hypothetical protein